MADPNNGHSFPAAGADHSRLKIITWGMQGWLTEAAIAEYAASQVGGEVYVLISQEQLLTAQQKAPNGVAWSDLVNDWNSIGGHLAPVPTPAPTPTPAPDGTVVTPAMATAWAAAGIDGFRYPLLTRAQAITAASAAISASWPKS